MNRWIGIAACSLLVALPACGAGGGGGGGGGTVDVEERDGIASDDFVDLLHYYFSSQEDGPGLYAYRPAQPDDAPVLIDPNVTISTPFSVTFPIAATEGGSSLHLRPKGVLYNAGQGFPPTESVPAVKSYLVTTDPSQLDSDPVQVSNHEYAGSFIGTGAYLTFGESLLESSIWISIRNMRLDLDMTADDEPLMLPEDGLLIGTTLGEGVRTHDHWLYIDADGSLKFYDEGFETGVAVIDEDTGNPMGELDVTGGFVGHLGVEHMLVVLAEPGHEGTGKLYRVARPSGADPGSIKLLTNDAGEAIEFALPGAIIGRTIPGESRRWNDSEAFYFSEGASILDSATPARVTRITADGWSAIEIEGEFTAAFTPDMFVRVDGGFFWAPSFAPEMIYPDNDDPTSWTRTPLPDAPAPENSTIFSSAGDWVYYHSNDDEAVAFNVKSGESVVLPDSTWVGASFVSDIGEEIRTDLIARQEIATVLVHLGGNRLGAVEGADPAAGVVILGDLPDGTEAVQVNGPAIGPARLVRVEYENGAIEIVAVDTREAGSLRRIMGGPAEEWAYQVDLAGTPLDIDVDPAATAPLKMF